MNLFQLATRGVDLGNLPDKEAPRQSVAFEPSTNGGKFSVPSDLNDAFEFAAKDFGIDPDVLRAVAYAESRFHPDVVSGKVKSKTGATGLMQFMPATAKEYGIDPLDPVQSIFGAAAYLRKSLDKFDGDYGKAVASYNAGPNRKDFDASDWDARMPAETQGYLRTVFTAADQLKQGGAATAQPTLPETQATKLPAGVKPSTAGGGRGSVSPGDINTKLTRTTVPDITAGSVAQDIGSGLLQVGPTAVKGVGELVRLATGDRMGKGITDFADQGIKSVQEVVGSDRAAAQRQNLNADMADDSIGLGQAIVNNKGALSDQIIPTLGSMAIPLGVAGAAGKAATLGRVAQGMDKAALVARVASVQQAAGIGATAAQNAASTFAELVDKGVSLTDAYTAAGITVPFSLIAGKLTGGGAEGALIKGFSGKAVARGAAETGKATLREGLQEGGESLGQVAGEVLGANQDVSLQSGLKRVGTEALLGAVVGGGTHAMQMAAPTVESQPTTPQVPPVAPTAPTADATQAVDNIAALLKQTEANIDGTATQATPVQPGSQAADAGTAPVAQGQQGAAGGLAATGTAAATGQSQQAGALTVPEKGSAVIPSVETGQSMAQRLTKPATPAQAHADTVVAEKAKPAPAYTPAIPQPGKAEAIVGKALESARKNADLADERLYSVDALQRIAAHPQANEELKAAATTELQRRADIEQVKQQQFEARRNGTRLSIPDAPPLRPLSVERGIEIAKASRDRKLLPQEQGYMDALKAEIGDQAFDLMSRAGKAPFMTTMAERKFDLPRLMEQNQSVLADWDNAHNQAQQPTAAPQAAPTTSPKAMGLAAEMDALKARSKPAVKMNIAPAMKAAQAPVVAPVVNQQMTTETATDVATKPAQVIGKGKKGTQKQDVAVAEEGGDKPKWWASQIGNATPAATHTAPEPYVQQLNSAVPSLAPDTNPSKETRRGANSIPTFQGGKTKMARAITDKVRQYFGGNAAKIDTIIDYFGGSGSWGAYMASSVFTNTKSLVIHEYNPERLSKIKLFNERGDQIASMLKNAKVVAFFDKIKKVIAEKETYSGSAIAGVVANREAYKKLIAEANAEIGADAMDGLLQAIEDQGQASFGLYGDGKTAESAVNDILRLVALNGAQAHTQMSALRARGVSISYVTGDSYQAQQVPGKNVLAMVDPPYYATKGYNGVNKVPIETYNETRKLLDRLRTAGNSVIYTDEAWWEKHDKNGKTDVPADLNKQVDGLDAFGQLRGIQSLMGDFFRMPIASRMEVVGLIDGNQNAGTVTATTPTDARTDARRDVRQDARGMDTGAGQQASGNVAEGNGRVSQGQTADAGIKASRRTSSGNRLPDVVIGHRLGELNNHPDYEAAKAGDSDAAARIASDLVDDAMVEAVRKAAGNAELIVPVLSVEATGRNKIPQAVAQELADRLGTDTADNIVQADSPKRTSMDGLSRLLNPPVFDGPVTPGTFYVLVDDTVTQGGTFASLASHIRDNGGEVAGVVALTGKQYSAKLEPSSELLQQVRDRFQSVEPAFRAATGYGFDALTESEARYLVKHNDAESVRARITEAGLQRVEGADQSVPEGTAGKQSQARSQPVSQRTAVAAIRTAIANAYGNLLTRLESKGLVSLTQTEEEAIAAAAQARADKTGGDVEAIKAQLRKSVLASQRAWHGTPHRGIEKFSTDNIGTGEGAQAFGWGLYFADRRELGEYYRQKLTGHTKDLVAFNGKQFHGNSKNEMMDFAIEVQDVAGLSEKARDTLAVLAMKHRGDMFAVNDDLGVRMFDDSPDPAIVEVYDWINSVDQLNPPAGGQLYEVDIPNDSDMLLWDKPMSQQSELVRKSLEKSVFAETGLTGQAVYKQLGSMLSRGTQDQQYRVASKYLASLGIKGIKYLDGQSRNKPLRDVKREFLTELPEDADFEEVMDLIGSGTFSPKNEALIQALADSDWLGFDYPSQAISTALSDQLQNFDPSPELLQAVAATQDDSTYNYVVFSGDDVQIVDVKYSKDGNLEGFFDPATGKSFLIADNLTAESAPATLMHEVGIHMAADGKLEPLFDRAANLLKMGRDNEFIQRVQARMDEAGETSNEEAAAYIVTEYEKDRTNAPASVGKWIKDFIADVRAWLFAKGVLLKADQLTVADIAAVARANANRMASGDGQGEVRYSKANNDGMTRAEVQRTAKEMGLPATGKTDEIARIVSIAQADPKTWTRSDFDAIKHYLSIHQDFSKDAEANEDAILRNGIDRGMVDRLGEMDEARGRTFAKKLTEKKAYVFISGALKYKQGSPHLDAGNVPLFSVTPIEGASIYDTIVQTAKRDVESNPSVKVDLDQDEDGMVYAATAYIPGDGNAFVSAEANADGTYSITESGMPQDMRGQGNGVALYDGLMRNLFERGATAVTSDGSVSPDAQKMYSALEKRGYAVKRNPDAVADAETGALEADGPVFTVTRSPDIRASVRNNAPRPASATPAPVQQPKASAWNWKDSTGRMQFAPGAWLYEKFSDKAGILLELAGMKSASPELKKQLRAMKLEVDKAQKTSALIAKETAKLTQEERNMVSDIIEKTLKAGVVPPAHAIKLAALINQSMEEQTNELVSLGMLSQEAADRWRGQYLPRYYDSKMGKKDPWATALMNLTKRAKLMRGIKGKHLKGRGMFETVPVDVIPEWEALGWEVRDDSFDPAKDDTVQMWRDFTEEERADMGEIKDAGFRFVMGYMATQKDVAMGRMFKAIADDAEMSSRTQTDKHTVRVPDTKVEGTGANVYGALAGRYVSKEVLDHLSSAEEAQSDALMAYRKAMSLWKEGKTVLNPVSHVNNTVSNLTMAHIAGVGYHRVDKYASAVRDFAKSAPMLQEAEREGLFLGGFNQAELFDAMPDDLKALAKTQDGKGTKIADGLMQALSFWQRDRMGKAYEFEDSFFKYLIYRDARTRGMAAQDAVDYAQRYIFTYDDLPKTARKIRDFGIPFFAYTYKAVPALLESAMTHPHRIGLPAAMLYAATTLTYAIAAGGDDEPLDELLKKYATDASFRDKVAEAKKFDQQHLPKWMQGYTSFATPKAIKVGHDANLDMPVFMDISRLIPGGDLFDVTPNAGGVPLPQPLTPSHPILTVLMGMLGNKDLFLGKDLVDKNDTSGEASEKRLTWLYRQLAPAIAVGSYHWNRGLEMAANLSDGEIQWLPDVISERYTGKDSSGLPVEPKYAIPQTVGIKLRPIDQDKADDILRSQDGKLIRDINAEIRQINRLNAAGALSDKRSDKMIEYQQMKLDRIRDGMTVDGDKRD